MNKIVSRGVFAFIIPELEVGVHPSGSRSCSRLQTSSFPGWGLIGRDRPAQRDHDFSELGRVI